jgi:UDP-N-acetylmuramoyl-tripeptide--D-alanyl-D-alanine ligase
MLTAISISVVAAATTIFYSRRLLCYLRHFQDNDYSPKLFTNWVIENGIYDRKGSLIATVAALTLEVAQTGRVISLLICVIASSVLVWQGLREVDPRKAGYPILQPTQKARAVYNLSLNLYLFLFLCCSLIVYQISADRDLAAYWLIVIVAIQSSPLCLLLADAIVSRSRRQL